MSPATRQARAMSQRRSWHRRHLEDPPAPTSAGGLHFFYIHMKSISSNFELAPLPDRITRKLAVPPSAGGGVHTWLFTMALQLHAYREPGEIVKLLTAAVKNCGRAVPPQEILDAVRNSKKGRSGGGAPSAHSSKKPRSKWPSVNEGNRAAIVKESPFNIATLKEESPAIVVEPPPPPPRAKAISGAARPRDDETTR